MTESDDSSTSQAGGTPEHDPDRSRVSPDVARLEGFDQPYTYDVDATAASLAERFGDLEPGSETGERASVAGRLMLAGARGSWPSGHSRTRAGASSCSPPPEHTRF